MSFTPFKEVIIANPGSTTRYGSDDLLDVMKILNGKTVSNRKPIIANVWRWTLYQEIKQMAEASVPTPAEADVVHLFQSATDNKLKVKKTGGTIVNLEDIGSGTWSNSSTETVSNKTVHIDTNTIKHSTTNSQGDVMFYDTTAAKYIRLARGTANQSLTVNAAGTSLEWQTITGGGGGGGEANTASNVGSAGIGIWYQKTGVDLQFKSLFSPDASVNISDDTGNQKIDLTIPAGIAKVGQANTFGDFLNTFRSSKLAITNPANTFTYTFAGSPIAGNRILTLPLLTSNDALVTETFATLLSNKTLGSGTVANTDVITLKHSTTNNPGDLLCSTGTKYDRLPRGVAGQHLMMNPTGTGIEWGVLMGGGIMLPDMSMAPSTGRWGAFWGGAADGSGMLAMLEDVERMHGSTISATESVTEIYTAAGSNQIAELKTAPAFRRDSTCVFKAKWRLVSTSSCKVKIGLSDATSLPAGGTGTLQTDYDDTQFSGGHLEFAGGISRHGIRYDSGASGLGRMVQEVTVRFRKYGSPSGNATVGIRKASDGTLVTLGTFAPNSFGSGEQSTTISNTSNTYVMVVGDRVTVEFPSNDTNGLELDQGDPASPANNYTSQDYDGTWGNTPQDTPIAIRIRSSTGGGTSGDTPLNSANGIMVHGTLGTHTNYQIARNNATTTQTTVDSGKALANTSTHEVTINLNSTNIQVTLDGTLFTYTTVIPATNVGMAWFFHIETSTAAERGLGIVYGQVVMTT